MRASPRRAAQVQRERELAAAGEIHRRGRHLQPAGRMPHAEEARQPPAFGLVGIDGEGHVVAPARVGDVVLAAGHGAVIALDPATGQQKWKFPMTDVTDSGILTTASNLLFAGGREGYFQALDARTGALLWRTNVGGAINSGPMTYRVGNRQYVSVVAGLSLFVFAVEE